MTTFQAGLITAIVSNAITVPLTILGTLWYDRRKDNKSAKKYKQVRTDAINFLKNLEIFRESDQELDAFFSTIGSYRVMKMRPIIKELRIANFSQTGNGKFIVQTMGGFVNASEQDLAQMMLDIKQGHYDSLTDNV